MDNPLTTHGNSQERMMAMIACIPPLFWVPIVLEKKTSYVTYFMKHGFVLLLIAMILSLMMVFLGFMMFLFSPLAWLIRVAILILVGYLAYHASIGKKVEIPFFTEHLDLIITKLGIKSWFEPK